jgi:hypothetical protein
MSKNTNLSFLTDFLTADIVNSRVGMNNVSPQSTFDVTGTGKFSGVLTLGSTVSNGIYAYTLPSATGTLALTSDIPSVSGYVPYTGATSSLDVGTNDLSGRYLNANGGVALGGVVNIKQDAAYIPRGNGYSSIASSNVLFDFFAYTGASTYKQFSLRFDGLTNNTNRIYTLPDASGTLALTSQIPANPVGGTGTTNYLPKFTGATTIGNSQLIDNGTQVGVGLTPNTSYGTLQIKSPASVYSIDLVGRSAGLNSENQITFWNSTQTSGLAYIYNSLSNLYIGTGANQPFTLSSAGNFIFGSTTDAGFKLDVNGTGRFSGNLTITNSGNVFSTISTTTNTGVAAYIATNDISNTTEIGTWGSTRTGFGAIQPNNGYIYSGVDLAIGSATNLKFATGGSNSTRLTINSLGAATFSSSVSAASLFLSGTIANGGDAATLTIKQASTTFTNGIYLERAGERNGYYMYIGGGLDALTFRRNYFGTQSDVMSLTRDGNVGIGTDSPYPNFRLHVNNTGNTGIFLSNTTNNVGGYLFAGGLDGLEVQSVDAFNSVAKKLMLNPYGGNVLIGTTTDNGGGQKLQVNGSVLINAFDAGNETGIFFRSGGASSFKYNLSILAYDHDSGGSADGISINGFDGVSICTGANTRQERMRITSGGYLKASNTGTYVNSTGTFHELNQNVGAGQIAVFRNSATSSPQGLEIAFSGADPNDTGSYMFGSYSTSPSFVWIYRIFSNGTVSARSDSRWKKNIETTRSGYIEDLCKLRVVKYNWYNHQDDAPKELGLIAQEVEEVFPNLIQIDPVIAKREVEQENGTIIEEEYEDGVSRSIKTSVLPFMLLKAIQEQQVQIEELKTEINKLKNA